MPYYQVQILPASGGYLADGHYLVKAKDLTQLDGVAKRLVAEHLHGADYIHRAVTQQVPDAILIEDGDSLKLGQDIQYDATELAKIDWSKFNP